MGAGPGRISQPPPPQIGGMSELFELIALLRDPEAYGRRLEELRDLLEAVNHSISMIGPANEVLTKLEEVANDRLAAERELADAREKARKLKADATADAKKITAAAEAKAVGILAEAERTRVEIDARREQVEKALAAIGGGA